MFHRNPPEDEALNATIAQLESDMKTLEGGSDAYGTAVTQLERLYKLREKNSHKSIDPNTLIMVGGNLAGILIIVFHERAHVITTKAFSQIGKMR